MIIKRVNVLNQSKSWNQLFSYDTVNINWTSYNNIKFFLDRIESFVQKLYDKNDITFIHWDFCLSNILYDTNNWIIKTIDPRGYFWELWVFWDHKYDIAKLRHSFVWFYDFIVSDLFKVNFDNKNKFELIIYNDDNHKYISDFFDSVLNKYWYNIEYVKFIEALLFLSMIPLHSDNIQRQYAMFCIAIQKLNEIHF